MRWRGPTTPEGPEPLWFGLFPSRSPLLGESLLFSLPPGTKMFQFPGFASPTSFRRWPVCNRPGCPIRKSADQWPFAPTRGLSQLVTSFIACESLGIRHVPFHTFAIMTGPIYILLHTQGPTTVLYTVCHALLTCHSIRSLRWVKLYSCSCTLCQRSSQAERNQACLFC